MDARPFPIATDYYVNQASVPLGVAVFVCSCGATRVECDLSASGAPVGWSLAADGTALCPRCASRRDSEEPAP